MTLNELNDYHNLIKQIATKEQQINNLRKNLGVGSPTMDGLPHGSGISDRTGNVAIEIADLESRLNQQKRAAKEKRPYIEQFINAIEDDITRLIYRFRILYGYTWSEVADTMGGYNTKESVRKRFFSFWEREANDAGD